MSKLVITKLTLEQLREIQVSPDQAVGKLPQLLETLSDQDQEIRAWAADCIQSVEELDAEAARTVAAYCSHSNESIASWACRLIGISASVVDYQDQLITALEKHDSLGVKQSAAQALAKVGCGLSERARVCLQQAADSSDARLQRLAKQALEQ